MARFTQSFRNSDTIADGAVLDGTAITFTNAESGRVVGGVVFQQGGHSLINELGGIVRVANGASEFGTAAVTGSSGVDTVRNAGSIIGLVNLGDGADAYYSLGLQASSGRVDLGSGDDLYFDMGGTQQFMQAIGGAGRDRFAVQHDGQNVFYGSNVTGFEDLSLLGGGQFVGFSGYQTITLGTPAQFGLALIDSANPLVDLTLAGNSMRLSNSSLRSVVGGSAAERFEFGSGSTITGPIDLAGGDDVFSLSNFFAGNADPVLPATGVAGGAGVDAFAIQLPQGRTGSFDLARVTGFEKLSINLSNQAQASVRIANANGFTAIDLGSLVSLTLEGAGSAGANLSGGFGGAIDLAAGSQIARYGFPLDGFFDQRVDLQQADDRQSVLFTNRGAVAGEMRFYIGDDLYDGRAGSVGGTVFGNAGNDTFLGGVGAERFEGGFGADRANGGGGDDALFGGAGSDTLDGGAGADELRGGTGDDSYSVDRWSASAPGDRVFEASNEGYDTVYASVTYQLANDASVEVLSTADWASTAALDLRGSGSVNRLFGNAGSNFLIGGGAADVLIGFAGDDRYGVDQAGDVVTERAGEGFDTVFAEVSYVLAADASVEILSTSDFASTRAIDLRGNDGAQLVYGNAGSNFLIGGGGADLLFGFGGDDSYGVDQVGDIVVEQAGQGFDTVYTSSDFALAAGVSVEVVSAGDFSRTVPLRLTGNELGQFIYGNAGSNLLIGGGGSDQLVGFSGDDNYGVNGSDDLVVEAPGEGYDTVYTDADFTLAAGTAVEVLSSTDWAGTDALALTGNERGQSLFGNAGANVLNGGGGADGLSGFGGADHFVFSTALGAGNVDRVTDFAAGIDKIVLDRAVFAALATGELDPAAFRQGTAAADADDRIIYDAGSGSLFYDADGLGGAEAVRFAQLQAGLSLNVADFIVL